MNKVKFTIGGMRCHGCSGRVKGALEKFQGVQSVEIDSRSGVTEVGFEDNGPAVDDMVAAVKNLGYTVSQN